MKAVLVFAVLTAAAIAYSPVDLDSTIRYWMDQGHLLGVQACAVNHDSVVWHGAYGWARLRDSMPVTDSTVFCIVSMSKPVTGTALMQNWEIGRFDLDADISDLLGYEVRNPNWPDDSITPRMLMSHTSSIVDNYLWRDTMYVLGDTSVTLGEFCHEYLVPGGRFYSTTNFGGWQPGTAFSYANVGAALAGHLVEAVTGNPDPWFCTHTRDSIFFPLGMHRACWLMRDVDTCAMGMSYKYQGGQHVPVGYWSWPAYPAASLKTTALEMSRFLRAFLGFGELDGVRILDSATVELMTTAQYPCAPNYGLLWWMEDCGGRSVWGHHGGPGRGMTAEMWWCEAETSGAIVIANTETGSRTPTMAIADALLNFVQAGMAEERGVSAIVPAAGPTIVRGMLFLPETSGIGRGASSIMIDVSGRKVMDLEPGENDIRHLAPGVYFVSEDSRVPGSKRSGARKVIIQH